VIDALDLAYSLVLEDGRRWGAAAAPFQRADVEAILSATGPRLHYLTRPRGASKTTDLAAVGIAALVGQLPDRSRSYAAAADGDQAALLVDSIGGFGARTDGLRSALRVDARKVTATGSGATLEVLAADEPGSWGLRPHTAGDGFFASFDGPARAIRCACAIVESMQEVGLEVRAGLHTGECELMDGKVAGIAVHTGARVASHAKPGEVLVSSTVKDLVAGSGLAFEDRGAQELKGIPGEWRLYALKR